MLISSLKNVHDLELESRKVPKLEAKIHHLENKIAQRRSQQNPNLLACLQADLLFRFMRGDQDNLVLSDSEPEESKLVNQSIEGDIDLAS